MTDMEQKIVFSRNLLRYIENSGKSQKEIADSLKVSPQTLNTWCQAKALPRMGKVQLLADFFGIAKSDLLDEKSGNSHKSFCITVPVLGRVAAGIPILMTSDIIGEEEISEELAAKGEIFGLKIQGNSMEPEIRDGDIVLVRQQPDVESGQIAIIAINGSDAVCKRLIKYADGISLVSINPIYEPRFFSAKEIENNPVRIIGRVMECHRKYF